jgi:DNA-binding beta-propeller fold protein YncE
MRRSSSLQKLLAPVLAVYAVCASAAAWSQQSVITLPTAGDRYIALPAEANFPEGLAADPSTGDLFVGTFDVQPDGSGSNFLLRYNRAGQLIAQLSLGVIPATGLAFNPRDRKVYFAQPGGLLGLSSFIQRIPASFNANTALEPVAMIPNIGAPAVRTERTLDGQPITISFSDSTAAPNGLAFRASDGALFLTDSLQAAVFRINNPAAAANICPINSACVQLVKQDSLLASAAFPQLGANGLVVSADESTLYVTNTGDDRLLSLRLSDGTLAVLTESLEGADGIQLGPDNTLIVSRALADEFAVIDPATGRILAELGEFRGIRPDGSVRGFLFPGSFVIVNNVLFANNLALPLSISPAEPELDVRVYTLSRLALPTVFPR